MKMVCGIDVRPDKTFFSLVRLAKSEAYCLRETQLAIPFDGNNFSHFLQANAAAIVKAIEEEARALSISVDTVYLNVPWGLEQRRVVESIVPLGKRKKITSGDILFTKKYVEDAYLDWDDFCMHHFVLRYEVEGKSYVRPPVGVVAKKIKLKSLLVWVKDAFRKDIEGVFSHLEKKLGGMIFAAASSVSANGTQLISANAAGIIDIGYEKSNVAIFVEGNLLCVQEFAFGLKSILQELAKKHFIPVSLSQEVFDRYISFRELPYFKEVSIKNADTYLNVSTNTVNSFVKEYIKNEINVIIEAIRKDVPQEFNLTVTGRLNAKDGFADFLKSFIPQSVVVAAAGVGESLSYGCACYAACRYLERIRGGQDSFFHRFLRIYKEYF
ncbi:MAG: hypothetical protein WCI77_06055 [Candidatus Omnitrophota bacterium]